MQARAGAREQARIDSLIKHDLQDQVGGVIADAKLLWLKLVEEFGEGDVVRGEGILRREASHNADVADLIALKQFVDGMSAGRTERWQAFLASHRAQKMMEEEKDRLAGKSEDPENGTGE